MKSKTELLSLSLDCPVNERKITAGLPPPYFNEHDVQTLNYFPYTFMRTNIIIGCLALPFYNKRYKGLGTATKEHAPSWFLTLAYITFWLGLLPGTVGLTGVMLISFMGYF